MPKRVIRTRCPLKVGDWVEWIEKESTGGLLEYGGRYQVDAVSGYRFHLRGVSIDWDWCEVQFRKVDKED